MILGKKELAKQCTCTLIQASIQCNADIQSNIARALLTKNSHKHTLINIHVKTNR